jgi:DeoR/GlpR family transcriptional regulator of sugar metabolism
MTDRGETYQRVSVPEAAARLGVSVATVRRMIRDGRLQAETIQRPQGIAYVVMLSSDRTAHRERSTSDHHVGTTTRANESDSGPAEAMVSLIRTTIVTVLGPVVAQLDAARQMVEHAQGQIVWQAEMIGRLTAERDAARAELAALKADRPTEAGQQSAQSSDPSPP